MGERAGFVNPRVVRRGVGGGTHARLSHRGCGRAGGRVAGRARRARRVGTRGAGSGSNVAAAGAALPGSRARAGAAVRGERGRRGGVSAGKAPFLAPRRRADKREADTGGEHARSNLHRLSIFSTTRRHRGSSSTTRTRRPSGNFGLSPSPAMMVPPGWVAGKCVRVPRADLFQPRFFTAPSRAYRDTPAFRAPRFERRASSAPRRTTSCASPWTCSVARARVVRGPGSGRTLNDNRRKRQPLIVILESARSLSTFGARWVGGNSRDGRATRARSGARRESRITDRPTVIYPRPGRAGESRCDSNLREP